MSENPLVSIIVPTRNSQPFLSRCLTSIRHQTYKNIELIVVDNGSTDKTIEIARIFTSEVLSCGPERSAQVNFGAGQARGDYLYKVDSDFELNPHVVQECVSKIREGADAVVVHNSPDPSVGWIARLRKFEVDMYKYDLTHSSARFIRKDVFQAIGGFDETITAGEDYDFQNRLNRAGYRTAFVGAETIHLGEPTSLLQHMCKYYRYGADFVNYRAANREEAHKQLRFLRSVYLRNWRQFIAHPFRGFVFAAYHCCKYGFGTAGFLVSSAKQWRLGRAARSGLEL